MSSSIVDLDLTRLLPPALKNDKNMLALGKSIASELSRTAELSRLTLIYSRIDELDNDLLDILAYDFHVDWYSTNLHINQKRSLIKNNANVHKYLGTKFAVLSVLNSLYPKSEVTEWFEYGGRPYHFKINLQGDINEPIANAKFKDIVRMVSFVKPLRSVLEPLIYAIDIPIPNPNTVHLSSLEIHLYNRYYASDIQFDGKRKFDGSWKFDNTTPHRADLHSLAIKSSIFNEYGTVLMLSISLIGVSATYNQDVAICIEMHTRNYNAPKNYLICISCGVSNTNTLDVTLTKDTTWNFDGEFKFDGKRKFNSAIITEQI